MVYMSNDQGSTGRAPRYVVSYQKEDGKWYYDYVKTSTSDKFKRAVAVAGPDWRPVLRAV